MSMVTEADVKEQLNGFEIEVSDPAVITRIQDICNDNGIQAERFVDEWISYSLKSGELNFVLSPKVLEAFLPELLKCCKVMPPVSKDKTIEKTDRGDAKKLGEYVTPDEMDLIEKYADEDTKQRARKEISSIQSLLAMDERDELNSPVVKSDPAEETAYAARKNPSMVIAVINEANLPDDWRDPAQTTSWTNPSPPSDREPCTLELASSHPTVPPLTVPYKYMYPQYRIEARVLSEQTEETAELIAAEGDLPTYETLEDGGQNVWVFGRVIPDLEHKQDSTIRANAFALLGTRECAENRWAKLDLSGMDRYSIFPGQNIAVLGRNEPNKKVIFVKEIRIGVPPPLVGHPITTHPLNVYIAAGPYTPDINLEYEALRDLTRVVSEAKPELLILFGPFVADHNKALGTKELKCNYKDLFKIKIRPILEAMKKCGTKVVLIPSKKDLFHHPILPQPPYPDINMTEQFIKGREVAKLSAYSNLYPDPAQFDFNTVRFAVTSTDIVTHMAKQEVAIEMKDRFSRILGHLLAQRRFYPLFPPNEDVNLEILKSIHLGINVRPHILILVSQMKEFLRMEGPTLCVNPGKLVRGKTGGSFCRLRVTDTGVSGQIIKI